MKQEDNSLAFNSHIATQFHQPLVTVMLFI